MTLLLQNEDFQRLQEALAQADADVETLQEIVAKCDAEVERLQQLLRQIAQLAGKGKP